jgi:hypothetical protein
MRAEDKQTRKGLLPRYQNKDVYLPSCSE